MDKQVIPRNWVLDSITGVDTMQGREEGDRTGFGLWGYLWQIDMYARRRYTRLQTREPVYMGTGSRGHIVFVAPYLDLVIAHQVATTGGIGLFAQIRRSIVGSREESDRQLQELFGLIISAHPDGDGAFATQ